MTDLDNTPKKKPRKKKEAKTTLASSILSGNPEPTKEQKNEDYINSILQNSLDRYKESVNRTITDYNEDVENLQNMALEYLDDFIIIGHTPDERRVVVRYAKSPRDYDALKELSREFLVRMMMGDKIEG